MTFTPIEDNLANFNCCSSDDLFFVKGLYISFIITDDDALTNVSDVDIKAAHKAAIIKPNTPGEAIKLATATNTSLGAIFSDNAPGTEL